MQNKNHLSFYQFVIFLCLVFASQAFAAEIQNDVGLITEISGKAFFSAPDQNASGKASMSEASVFMKIRKNDLINVEAKSSMTILYQSNGRREVWNGPVEIRIGDEEGTVKAGEASKGPNKTENMAVAVSDKVFMASELGESGKLGKAGIRVVRSGSETPESRLADGLEKYKKMKSEYGEKDVIPEMYLLSLYSELGKQAEMEAQLKSMRNKWPGNVELEKWAAKLKAK